MEKKDLNAPGAGQQSASSYAPYAVNESEYDSGEIIRVFMRNKQILLGALGVCLVLGFVAILMITPKYEAEALVMIEPQENRVAAMEPAAGALAADLEAVRSETYIISSSDLINRVIEDLDLEADEELNPDADSRDSDASPAVLRSELIDRFKKELGVGVIKESRVISIRYQSEDPEKAQRVANSMAEQYLDLREAIKLESSSRLANWLEQEIGELRSKVQDGESQIEQLRQKYGLVEGERGDLRAQELAQVSTQLVMTRADVASAQATLDQALLLKSSDNFNARTASDVINSPLIQDLRTQESVLQADLAELSSELGDHHPRMVQLRAEIAELRTKIDFEIDTIIAGLENQVNIAKARERSLVSDLNALKSQVATMNEGQIEIRSLEREVEADQALLEGLLRRKSEAVPQRDSMFLESDVRIISRAQLPTSPAYPDKKFILGLALFGSILLGSLIILFKEMMERGFRSTEELDAYTGIASLGFIPKTQIDDENTTLVDFLRQNPSSAFAESIRTLMWSIKLTLPGEARQIIAISSSTAGEGKSTVAAGLAVSQAASGERTLLINADIRKKHRDLGLGVEDKPGLAELLAGKAKIDEVIQSDTAVEGLDVISAGDIAEDVPRLLGSEEMNELMFELREKYNLIFIDTPPILVGADVQLIGRVSDATVLVVRWGTTARATVRHSMKILQNSGSVIAGTVLSIVDARKYSQYNYGDSGAYAGNLAKYYAHR